MTMFTQLQSYLSIGWRHRWKALLLTWVISLAGFAAVQLIPDQYRASARIYADADAILGQALRGIAVEGATAAQVDFLQRTLLSRPNLERVIARTDLDQRIRSTASRDAVLKDLARSIKIIPQTKNLFQLEYNDGDPRIAQSVVQAVLNLFMEMASSNDRQQMENARNFIGQQISTYEIQLREAEQRRADFRTRYIDLLPNDVLGGISRLESARNRLNQFRGELQDAQARRTLTKQQLDATPATITESAGGGSGRASGGTRVADAEQRLRDLRLRFTDQHPEVAIARAALADAKANPEKPAASGGGGGRAASRPNPAREQLQLRQVDADASVVSLERQVRDETAQVERLETLARGAPQLQAQFQNLDRDYNVLRKQYEELLERRESLQIAGAARVGADQVRIEIVEPPTLPTLPTGPNRPLLTVGALVAGIAAGLALAALLAITDQGFMSVQDLRRLGLPVLGSISAAPAQRRAGPVLAFVAGFALLLATFGAVLVKGDALASRMPALVARVLA
jgi:polysaccharide chain length determinant protein (PEP-CTERM system associated)